MFRKMNAPMGVMMSAAVLAAIGGLACRRSQPAAKNTGAAAVPIAEITVVGCVRPSDQSKTGTVGTSGSASDTTYMLTNAKSASQPDTDTYRLDAQDSTLSPEVGHQVEIVAIIEEPDGAATGGSKALAPKLKVETIKMIAAPCPE